MTKSRKIDKIFIDMFDHGVHKEDENVYEVLLWNAEGKGPVEDPGVDGKMIWILKKGMVCFGFIWRRRMTVGVVLATSEFLKRWVGGRVEDFSAVWVTIDFSKRKNLL